MYEYFKLTAIYIHVFETLVFRGCYSYLWIGANTSVI
jgi:hypothetical protein